MNTESPPSGRLVRSLAPQRWELEEKGKWRIDIYEGENEFVATLYQSAKQKGFTSEHEFSEGRGADKQLALEALREATEKRMANVTNALSFDWTVDG